ncbi:hypothetical protein ACTFIY_010218 [Dictyostelium cf. discoideum]
MIIKEKKSKLNLKYIWLIKIKPKINRGVISFFHSINQCFSKKVQKVKDKKSKKREKEIDDNFRTGNPQYSDFIENNNNNNNKNVNNKKSKKHHHHHHHNHNNHDKESIENNDFTNTNYNNNNNNNNNNNIDNINVPYVNGEIAMEKKTFDNSIYLEELSNCEQKYENEKTENGNASNETTFEYAKILSHSQNKNNRKKSIELLLELLNSDSINSEKYLIELGTTYYKQEDFNNALIYADKVLQSSPMNRQALSLKYLSEPVPLEVKA